MSRKVSFRQADLERTVRALKAVGETNARVDIQPDGTISILIGGDPTPQEPLSPLEAWEREHGDRAA